MLEEEGLKPSPSIEGEFGACSCVLFVKVRPWRAVMLRSVDGEVSAVRLDACIRLRVLASASRMAVDAISCVDDRNGLGCLMLGAARRKVVMI